jgi:hypothetical protein
MTATAILLVTWFYYGQPPATSQTEFPSMEACMVARNAVLGDAARLKSEAHAEVARLQAQGVFSNPIIPTVSAVCAPTTKAGADDWVPVPPPQFATPDPKASLPPGYTISPTK